MNCPSLRRKTLFRRALPSLAMACLIALPLSANAQYTWTGANGDRWDVLDDWRNLMAPPANRFTTDLLFSTQYSNHLSTDNSFGGTFDLNDLNFVGVGWNLYGNNLGFSSTGTISIASGGSATVANQIITGADGSGGALTITAGLNSQLSFMGSINGTGGVNYTGAGLINVDAPNSYVGTSTVSANVYAYTSDALGDVNNLVLNGGQLNMSQTIQEIGSLSGNAYSDISMDSGSLYINQTGNTTYAGSISSGMNSGLIDVSGGGVLTFSGDNRSSTVNLEIDSGQVNLGSANSGLNGAVALYGGILNQQGYAMNVTNLTFGNGVGQHVGVIVNPGTITLAGTLGYAGNGSLFTDAAVVSGPLMLTAGQHNIDFNNSSSSHEFADIQLLNLVYGPGGINLVNGNELSTLLLDYSDTYGGATNISQNSLLQAEVPDAIPQTSAVTMTGGSLSLYNPGTISGFNTGSFNQSIGSLSGSGGVLLGSATLTTGNDNSSTVFSGEIGGSGSTLVKVGSGTFTLSGLYYDPTGNLDIQGGTLGITNMDVVPGGNLTLAGGNFDQDKQVISISNLVFGNGSVAQSGLIFNPAEILLGGDIDYVGAPNLATSPEFVQNALSLSSGQHNVNFNQSASSAYGVDLALIGQLSGPGGLTLIGGDSDAHHSILVLGDQNSYGGSTVLGAYTDIAALATGAIPSTSAVDVQLGGELVMFNAWNNPAFGSGSFNESIGSLAGAGVVLLGDANLTTGSDNANSTFSGTLLTGKNGGVGGVTKVGEGTWTLSNANAEFWSLQSESGGLVMDHSTVTLDSTANSGNIALGVDNTSVSIQDGSHVNVASGGTTDVEGYGVGISVTGSQTVFNAGGNVIVGATDQTDSALSITSGGAVNAGTIVVGGGSGIFVNGSGSSLNAGVLDLGSGQGSPGSLEISHGASVTASSIQIADNSYLSVDKSTLTVGAIQGSSSYDLALSNPRSGSALSIGAYGTSSSLSVTFTDASDGIGGITLNGGQVTVNADQTYTGTTNIVNGNWSLNGVKTDCGYAVGSNGLLYATAGSTLNLGSNTLQVTSQGEALLGDATVIGGFLKGPGTIDLFQDSDGYAPALIGTTEEASADIENYSRSTLLQNFTNEGTINDWIGLTWDGGTNQASGTVNFKNGGVTSIDNFESYGVVNITSGSIVNNSGSSLTLGGGSRTYIGTVSTPYGTLDLGGYTLELNGGLLVNNGVIQNGLVNINYGSTAKGAGDYAGGYSVNYGGTFLPGNSPGIVKSGNAFWNEGGDYVFQIDDATGQAGTGWGLSQVMGRLSISAGSGPGDAFEVDLDSLLTNGNAGLLADFNPEKSYEWQFLTTTGGIVGFNYSEVILNLSGFANSYTGRFSLVLTNGGDDLAIQYQAVPTPPGAFALGMGLVGLAVRRRKRSQGLARSKSSFTPNP